MKDRMAVLEALEKTVTILTTASAVSTWDSYRKLVLQVFHLMASSRLFRIDQVMNGEEVLLSEVGDPRNVDYLDGIIATSVTAVLLADVTKGSA